MVDEYTRESLEFWVARRFTDLDVVRVLERLIAERGLPEDLRSDNSPKFIARALRSWLERTGIQALYITPEIPWENAYRESFNSRFRDEFLNRGEFTSELEARLLSAEWRWD